LTPAAVSSAGLRDYIIPITVNKALNRVAIIDDDASVCRALGRLLRGKDFETVEYHSAEEFLAAHSSSNYCCLLVDIQLSGMSGLELPHQLAAKGDRTPVIFITAHDDPALRDKAIKKGGARFFRKTESFELIIEALGQLGCESEQGSRRSKSSE
jgi:FixJ family two-component response regulator